MSHSEYISTWSPWSLHRRRRKEFWTVGSKTRSRSWSSPPGRIQASSHPPFKIGRCRIHCVGKHPSLGPKGLHSGLEKASFSLWQHQLPDYFQVLHWCPEATAKQVPWSFCSRNYYSGRKSVPQIWYSRQRRWKISTIRSRHWQGSTNQDPWDGCNYFRWCTGYRRQSRASEPDWTNINITRPRGSFHFVKERWSTLRSAGKDLASLRWDGTQPREIAIQIQPPSISQPSLTFSIVVHSWTPIQTKSQTFRWSAAPTIQIIQSTTIT